MVVLAQVVAAWSGLYDVNTLDHNALIGRSVSQAGTPSR
jgi:hypothetical protein